MGTIITVSRGESTSVVTSSINVLFRRVIANHAHDPELVRELENACLSQGLILDEIAARSPGCAQRIRTALLEETERGVNPAWFEDCPIDTILWYVPSRDALRQLLRRSSGTS